MRKIILFLVLAFCLGPLLSGQSLVSSAYNLAWDNVNELSAIGHSRVYLSRSSGIVPDGISFVAEFAEGTYEWPIVAANGRWYAVVTFTFTDPFGTLVETPPSDEITFIVVGRPTNERIEAPQ
jgi:hypothetical protein